MDVYCPRCGEPYEADFVYHEMDDAERRRFKTGKGCSDSCAGQPPNPILRAQASGVVMEALGDDLDGAASLLDDFEWAGMLDAYRTSPENGGRVG